MGTEHVCVTGIQELELLIELERHVPLGKVDFESLPEHTYDVVFLTPTSILEGIPPLKPGGRGLISGITSDEGIQRCKEILNELDYHITHSEVRREIGQGDRWVCILFR